MNPATIKLLLGVIDMLAPGAIALIQDIRGLSQKYPGLTPAQFNAIVLQTTTVADATFDSTITEILADQAAHKTGV
jgi:hypothetical protein